MNSRTRPSFWRAYDALDPAAQKAAQESYALFVRNPNYPSLRFKKLGGYEHVWSVRVSEQYRAVGERQGDTIWWVWIGEPTTSSTSFFRKSQRTPHAAILRHGTATPNLACEIPGLTPKPPIPAAEVKAAYRAAILHAHPDKGGSNEHAAIINAAYAFLKPFSKRSHLRQRPVEPLRTMALLLGKDRPAEIEIEISEYSAPKVASRVKLAPRLPPLACPQRASTRFLDKPMAFATNLRSQIEIQGFAIIHPPSQTVSTSDG